MRISDWSSDVCSSDLTVITRPCTKHNYLVKAVADLPRTVHEAFYVARSGRPGPVVIDLPKDVLQNKTADYIAPEEIAHRSYRPQTKAEDHKIAATVEMIAQTKRQIVYAYGGVINAGPRACELLARFRSEAPTTELPSQM